jgi:exo-beta-1,3-glucanase (GH17 family)
MRSYTLTYVLVATVLFTISGVLLNCTAGEDDSRDGSFTVRPFTVEKDGRWIGNAICYGPHRDGQRPGGPSPSAEELREDLNLMLPHWNLLRVYAASEFTETFLSIIRDNSLDMHVVLGVWIAPEERRDENGVVLETFPDDAAANDKEVAAAIRLAAAFPEIVSAVCVGNETQIYWSAHRSPLDILIDHVRRVRSGVSVPVTVADDFNFWNKPESRALAAEIDFVMMHAHPMWNGLQLEDALTWLQEQIGVVQKMHPDRSVVLGETGWATSVHTEGEQAELIKGKPGEAEQKFFYEAVRKWADSERFPVFFFEAFDENWKGGPHPAEVEKHWGLFNADRSPKEAME